MNTEAAVIEERRGLALDLDFKMSSAEHFEVSRSVARMSRCAWLPPSCGVLLVALAAFSAGSQYDSLAGARLWFFGFTTVFQFLLGWNMATNDLLTTWLGRRLSRGQSSHTGLELDSTGIRGFIEFPSPSQRRFDTKRINYAWRKVRKIYHPPDYIVLEFHGGGIVTIPKVAFDTRDDMQQFLDWAEEGLAQQWPQRPVRKPTAA